MPNHVHGVVTLIDSYRGTACRAPIIEQFGKPTVGSIPTVIRSYKSAVKKWCNENGFKHFQWQRNYYEYIVRGEKDLDKIRDYIIFNSGKWGEDRNNPKNFSK